MPHSRQGVGEENGGRRSPTTRAVKWLGWRIYVGDHEPAATPGQRLLESAQQRRADPGALMRFRHSKFAQVSAKAHVMAADESDHTFRFGFARDGDKRQPIGRGNGAQDAIGSPTGLPDASIDCNSAVTAALSTFVAGLICTGERL
jgi:hypothetical protein